MSRTPARQILQRRTRYALEQARAGKTVVVVMDGWEHVGHVMTELELNRRVPGEVLIRRNGAQGLDHTRSGGSIRFRTARNPDSLRGLHGVDVFLVDPRVATSTELEQNMQLACKRDPDRYAIITAQVVRPGDDLTVGQLAGVRP